MINSNFFDDKKTIIAIIAGIIIGIISFAISLDMLIIAAAAVIFISLILWKVEIGIFTIIGFVPFMPTMAVLGLILLTLISFTVRAIRDRSFILKGTPMDMFVLLFAFMLLYGGLVSFSPKNSMLITITYILFISFYFISVNTVKTTKQLEKLILLFVTAGFFVALYGVFQYISGGPTTASWVDDEMFQDIRVRIYSTFENPNVLGEYLVLLIPLSMSILWGKKIYFHALFQVLQHLL